MTSKEGPQIKRKSVPLIGQSAESFQIGPLSPSLSDSLTNGTSIPAPDPPPPPPKEPSIMDRPSTPSQQQPSTLTDATYNRFFPSDKITSSHMSDASPTNDSPPPPQQPSHTSSKLQKMGYEASASASQSPYAPSIQPSATDPSPRRPSGVFRLFKRRYDDTRTSSSAESITSSSTRPHTPGADSVIGSLADSESGRGGKIPKNKKSGTFWGRRKSSLNFMTGVEESSSGGPAVQQRNGNNTAAGNSMRQQQQQRRAVSGNAGENTAFEGGEEEEFPPRLKQKKSLTFWRRTSSLGLDRMGSGSESAYGPGNHQPTRNASIDEKNAAINGQASLLGEDTVMSEADAIASRPRSPPPVLPDVGVVVHEKGGLMGGEDWFGDIR
ncbi:MAG: hypothetical protein LQ349_008199 [Xanthoria aureola]|nr:MAG: hypothetical protein LQ349_008199 [Xanthoria aureola]